MACCGLEKREALKVSAMELGFDGDWIADVLETWGDEILSAVVDIARNGISVDFIVETLRKFGPLLLDFVSGLLNRRTSMGLTGEVVPGAVAQGINSAFLDTLVEKFMPQILEKILPELLDKFGSKIFEFLTKWLLNLLNKN